jgi:hypothetical protein
MIANKAKLTVEDGITSYEADKQLCFTVANDQIESVEKAPLNEEEECRLIIRTKTAIIHTITNNDEDCEDIISKMYEDVKKVLRKRASEITGTSKP